MNESPPVYKFGEFRLNVGRRTLFKNNVPVPLAPKAFEVLVFLIENSDRVVEKDELMSRIWQDTFVEDNNLTVHITLIRRALDEKKGSHNFILTIPRRGYRFIAPVTVEGSETEKDISDISVAPAAADSPKLPLSQTSRKTVISRILIVSAVLLVAGLTYWGFASRRIETANQIRTLAVLPFKPLAPSEQDAILGIGMADTLITKLSGINRIAVRPTSAIAKYAIVRKEPAVIGGELGVDALLEGSIQRTADKLRLSVQLIRVSDGVPLWAGTFDAKESDIFAVQDSISSQIVDSLSLKLDEKELRQIKKHSTDNPESYKLYLNGLFQLSKRTLESANRAISYFNQAIEKQPDYALAYAGLGDAYIMLGNQEALLGGLSPRENIPKAKAALTKALSLDGTLAEAWASMAWVSIWETGQTAVSAQNLRHALELNPNSVNAHHYSALLLMSEREFDQALLELQKARDIDQFSLVVNVNIGTVMMRQKRYDEAEAQCRKTLELDPNFPRTHWVLGLVLEQKGQYPEAIASFTRAVELSKGGTLAKASLAHAYAKSGNRAEAEKILNELLAGQNVNYVSPDAIASVYMGLGNKELALEYLEKAVGERQFSMFQLDIEQRFDEIRTDQTFQKIENLVRQPRPIDSGV